MRSTWEPQKQRHLAQSERLAASLAHKCGATSAVVGSTTSESRCRRASSAAHISADNPLRSRAHTHARTSIQKAERDRSRRAACVCVCVRERARRRFSGDYREKGRMIGAAETLLPRRCRCDLRTAETGSPDKTAARGWKVPFSSSAGAEPGGLGTQEPAVAEQKGPAGRGASSDGRTDGRTDGRSYSFFLSISPSLPLSPRLSLSVPIKLLVVLTHHSPLRSSLLPLPFSSSFQMACQREFKKHER